MGDSDKKLMLLTGGNSGIGLEAVKVLCARGHKLIVTVRSEEKGEHCLREVKAITPDADINYMICEMSDPSEVRKLAAEFQNTWLTDGQLLDVLINNAGGAFNYDERTMCEANPTWEKTFATNAIAPILLTDLLMDNLKETAAKKGDARVVMVSSSVIKFDNLIAHVTDLEDVMIAKPKGYKGGMQTYKNSKVSLTLATQAMSNELAGSGVTINSLCPGMIPGTNLSSANTPKSKQGSLKCLACCCCCLGQSNEKGGSYIVQVADDEHGKSQGLFFIRGSMTELPPQCMGRDRQNGMLQILRDLPKEGVTATA